MRVGLFGGCFDPIHTGHIVPVQAARRELELDRIIYLPTAEPPHKPGPLMAPAYNRYAMVELALLDQEGLFASAFELTPGREAFTIDSLEHFQAQYSRAELFLILGADGFLDLPTWRRWNEIPELATIAVLVRPHLSRKELLKGLTAELAQLASSDRVCLVGNEPIESSSTRLRDLVKAGSDIPDGTLPPLVLEYIRKYTLYR